MPTDAAASAVSSVEQESLSLAEERMPLSILNEEQKNSFQTSAQRVLCGAREGSRNRTVPFYDRTQGELIFFK